MAYGELYRFAFDAADGPEVTISVSKKDYSGTVYRRAVGGSAVLKREKSGHILGSSLEWAAECLVEDEFADLYTSDPTQYKVEVKFGASRVWRGFVTPELYSAPWVNAPYDITLTASDNLAELKNYKFKEQGNKTVRELLLLLLAKTNQDVTSITAISSLSGDGNGILSLTVNMDAMTGSTYYEVLDGLLETFHAYIRFDAVNLRWLILRETDVSNYSGISYLTFSSLSGTGRLIPVGNLSMEVEPARKEITVSEEIIAGNVADEFNSTNVKTLQGSPKWEMSDQGATVHLWTIPADELNGTPERIDKIAGVLFRRLAAKRQYTLTFKARSSSIRSGSLKWGLLITDGKESIFYNNDGYFDIEYSGDDFPVSQDLTSEWAEYSYNFEIPDSAITGTAFVPTQGAFSAKCKPFKAGDLCFDSEIMIADVRLSVIDFPDGLATKVILDNSARTIGDEVTLAFGADIDKGRKNIIQETAFTSAAITEAKDFNSFMAIDNALSVATPRLRLSGLIMSKTAAWALPEFVRTAHSSADNLDYLVEEYSFNLITGEIDLSMLSLPAASLSYTELTTSGVYNQGTGGSGGSGSSSSSGGTGAPGAAAGFDTPTATATAVDGTTPTASVTASGPDTAKKFSFSFGIPKATATADDLARLQTRPRLKMSRGTPNEQEPVNRIIVSHPLLTSTAYEAVLMRYRRYNRTKRGTDQYGNKLFIARKGWFVALGDSMITDHAAFAAPGTGGKAAIEVSELRDFIVKRFMTDSNHTQAELFGRTYEQWAAESNSGRGFGDLKKTRQRFGIAVRYANPAFTALLDSSKTLGNTTMELNHVPRYLYSDVAPIDVRLFSPGGSKLMSEIWIGLVY